MHPGYPPPPPPKSNTMWIVLAIVGGVLGVAVLIWVFTMRNAANLEYMKKSRRSEAEVNLDAIKKAVKAQIPDNAGFVEATTSLTPAESCCDSSRPDKKCEPDAAQWFGTDWDKLDFQVDEPHLFRYAYRGTAEHFEAIAVGDLDCDGTEVTYRLTGDYNSGDPQYTLDEPSERD